VKARCWKTAIGQLVKARCWKTAIGQRQLANHRVWLENCRQHTTVLPTTGVLDALHATPLSAVRVVVLGVEPEIVENRASGFAWANPSRVGNSPTLLAIYTAMAHDLPSFGIWGSRLSAQGVLLHNLAPTTTVGGSQFEHWREFSQSVLRALAASERPLVWLVWGNITAAATAALPIPAHHCVLRASAPLTPEFAACNHFSATNKWLTEHGQAPIDW